MQNMNVAYVIAPENAPTNIKIKIYIANAFQREGSQCVKPNLTTKCLTCWSFTLKFFGGKMFIFPRNEYKSHVCGR